MLRSWKVMLRSLCISAALLCLVHVATAEDFARAFAATYSISNVVEDGDKVQMTMTLKVLNPGSPEVKGGIVVMQNSQPNPMILGSFSAISSLPRGAEVTVNHSFTVSRAEFSSWQHGHAPRFEFLIPGAGGAVAAGIQAHEASTQKVPD